MGQTPRCQIHPAEALKYVRRGWFCEDCGLVVAAHSVTDSAPKARFEQFVAEGGLEDLPSSIALPLQDLALETHPVVRLWRVCDVTELLLRFCVAIGAAELDGQIPESVCRIARNGGIERPSLATWLQLAVTLAKAGVERVDGVSLVVPELHHSVRQLLEPLVMRGSDSNPADAVHSLRNELAHGAGMPRSEAELRLPGFLERLTLVLQDLAWLRDGHLVAIGVGGNPVVLSGPRRSGIPHLLPLPAEIYGTLQRTAGQVTFLRGLRALPLFPLQAYLTPQVLRRHVDFGSDDIPAPLVYRRYERRGLDTKLELTVFGSNSSTAELRGDAVSRLRALFRLDDPRSPDKDILAEGARLIGRQRELAHVELAVSAATGSVLWLAGVPGIGKSALVAAVVAKLQADSGPRTRVIAWRFRTGDPRCSRTLFLRGAIQSLESWELLGARNTDRADDVVELEQTLGKLLWRAVSPLRVVFALDGIDEVARIDQTFPELPFRHLSPTVVWFCAGRPEPALQTSFSPIRSTQLFPDGLGPLDATAITEWIRRDAPDRERDALTRNEIPGQPTVWVQEVLRCSGGLPAYIALLVDDLNSGEVRVGNSPPRGLNAYFELLVGQAGGDDPAAALPTILATISLAVQAPSEDMLIRVLRACGRLRAETEARHVEIVREALGRAQGMLRIVTLENGVVGYFPYHEALNAHLQSTPRLADARAAAAVGWTAVVTRPPYDQSVAANCIFSIGIRQLVAIGRASEAVELLVNLSYLIARLKCSGLAGVGEISADWNIVLRQVDADARVTVWAQFWRSRSSLLSNCTSWPPHKALLQLAHQDGTGGPISSAAEEWLSTGQCNWTWIRRVNRPTWSANRPGSSTLKGHRVEPSRMIVSPDGSKMVSWGEENYSFEMICWDIPLREAIGTYTCEHVPRSLVPQQSAVSIANDGQVIVNGQLVFEVDQIGGELVCRATQRWIFKGETDSTGPHDMPTHSIGWATIGTTIVLLAEVDSSFQGVGGSESPRGAMPVTGSPIGANAWLLVFGADSCALDYSYLTNAESVDDDSDPELYEIEGLREQYPDLYWDSVHLDRGDNGLCMFEHPHFESQDSDDSNLNSRAASYIRSGVSPNGQWRASLAHRQDQVQVLGPTSRWSTRLEKGRHSSNSQEAITPHWLGVSDNGEEISIVCSVIDHHPWHLHPNAITKWWGVQRARRGEPTAHWSTYPSWDAERLRDLAHSQRAAMEMTFPLAVVADGLLCPARLGLDLIGHCEPGKRYPLVASYVSAFELSPIRWASRGVFAVADARGVLHLVTVERPSVDKNDGSSVL